MFLPLALLAPLAARLGLARRSERPSGSRSWSPGRQEHRLRLRADV
jgi:hypothetical protein